MRGEPTLHRPHNAHSALRLHPSPRRPCGAASTPRRGTAGSRPRHGLAGRPAILASAAAALLIVLPVAHGCSETSAPSQPSGAGGASLPGDPCEVEGAVQSCYPGSPSTRGIGACHDGTSRCTNGLWADCTGYQIPSAELCNGLDEDCNGAVDDHCGEGGSGASGGTAGAGGSGASGGSPPSVRLYHHSFSDQSASFVSMPATDVWTGPNAPDPSTVVAVDAAYGTPEPWLFAVSTDGFVHLRRSGSWLVPQPLSTTFAGLDAVAVNTLTIWQAEAQGPQTFQFTARSNGTEKLAYDYSVTLPAFVVTASADNPIVVPDDADPAAPPHYMVDLDWSFVHQTAYVGTQQWVLFYMQCGVNAYLLDGGNFTWANLGPTEQSFLWGAVPTLGPAATTVRAAWLEQGDLYLLAP